MLPVLIEYANSASNRWAVWMVTALVDSAALLALVSLVWLAIRKRVAPQAGYGLFLLVPLKLLLPVQITVPMAIGQWTPSARVAQWFEGARGSASRESRPTPESHSRIVPNEAPRLEPTIEPSAQFCRPADQARSVLIDSPTATGAAAPIAPRAGELTKTAAQSPQLTPPAVCLLAWLLGVVVLFNRLARTQFRFRARIQYLVPVDGAQLGVDIGELCRRAGVTQTIRIIESEDIRSPAVSGILRPTIILPRGIASSLSAQQLRWVLLHELAHIRRCDLLVVVVQRSAAILHFFNPAVWIANRVIHRLREYACDDLAVSLGDGSAVESGEAFMQILRHAQGSPRVLDGALGIFGLDSRASCFLRVRRLLDTERRIHTRLGRWAFAGLLLAAVAALPHLRAAGDDAKDDDAKPDSTNGTAKTPPNEELKKKARPDEALAINKGEFELRVVDPDGKSVPEAMVHLDADFGLAAEQFRTGKFVRKGSYGVFAKTDLEGRLAIAFPREAKRLNVNITTPGYGPYWAAPGPPTVKRNRFRLGSQPSWRRPGQLGASSWIAKGGPLPG